MSPQCRILMINGPLPPPYGGIATYLSHTLPYLARQGFEVHTIMDRTPSHPGEYDKFLDAGIHIYYAKKGLVRKFISLLKNVNVWMHIMMVPGIDYRTVPKLIKSIVTWLDVSELVIKAHSIDIIHAYDYPWVQGFVAAFLSKKHGKIFVQTTFGEIVPHLDELVHHDSWGGRYVGLVRHVLNQADLILSLSNHCAKELEFVGITRTRVVVIHYGVDINIYHPKISGVLLRERMGISSVPMILFLGQVRLRKGPQILVEALPKVLGKHPTTRIVIAGPDFGISDMLERRANELGARENVIFLGSRSQNEILELYGACDVFVFPTCTPIECLGLSMIQAMACGKPVVGSKINGIPEVIVDSKTGFLVEPSDPEDLAIKLNLLLDDSKLRKRMGVAGRHRVEKEFEQGNLVKRLETEYGRLMKEH